MARRSAKVSEEEIVAINEAAFFYPSDLENTKTTIQMNLLQSKYMPYIGLPRGQRTRAINHITPRFSITLTWQTERYDILACTFKFVHFQDQSIQ